MKNRLLKRRISGIALTVSLCLLFQMPASAMIEISEGPGAIQDAMEAQNAAAAGRQLDPNKPMIAFTYDDGPCTGPGNRIIDCFLKYNQRCTFFLVGNRISSRAEEVKRMADNGFEIGNHSWDHKYYTGMSAGQIRKETERCNEAIRTYAGVEPRLARTPGGSRGSSIISAVNMPVILWNIDTLDWKTRNVESNVNAVLGKVKDGDVILMHELYFASAEATEILVPKLIEQGFQLVTVSELAQYKGKDLKAGTCTFSF